MKKRDFFSEYYISTKHDIDDLIGSRGKFSEINDILTKVSILTTALINNNNQKDYAKVGEKDHESGLKLLVHSSSAFNTQIQCRLSDINLMGIDNPIDISDLPKGTTKIEFPITLKTPYISRDDAQFYIIDAPVRKERVFGIPFTSAMSWKGNLRWTMMKLFLEKANNVDEFVETRIRHMMLFGTEKGLNDNKDRGWVKYVDEICEEGISKFQETLKERFHTIELPNIQGSLYFYPTFWNKIDMEVINPHNRQTKTGKNPIYFEVVPAGAQGNFRLLYIPHTFNGELHNLQKNLEEIVEGLKAMMLTYGFSAKKSSGYGVIEDKWNPDSSALIIKDNPNIFEKFGNFSELILKIQSLK